MKTLLTTLALAAVSTAAFANNVQVQISSSDLNFQGDAFANSLRIDRTPTGVRVVGIGATRINGLPSVTFVTGPLVNVTGQLDGGNDLVIFNGLGNVGDVNLEAGAGNDTFQVLGTRIGQNLNLKGELGNDTFLVSNSSAAGDVYLDGGEGANTVRANGVRTQSSFSALGGELADRFEVSGITALGPVGLFAGRGNNIITASSVSGSGLAVQAEDGIDTITLLNASAASDIIVESGAQSDRVTLTGVRALGSLGVNLDAGNDTFTATSVMAAYDAIAIGGAGTDRFINQGFMGGIKVEILEFELR